MADKTLERVREHYRRIYASPKLDPRFMPSEKAMIAIARRVDALEGCNG